MPSTQSPDGIWSATACQAGRALMEYALMLSADPVMGESRPGTIKSITTRFHRTFPFDCSWGSKQAKVIWESLSSPFVGFNSFKTNDLP